MAGGWNRWNSVFAALSWVRVLIGQVGGGGLSDQGNWCGQQVLAHRALPAGRCRGDTGARDGDGLDRRTGSDPYTVAGTGKRGFPISIAPITEREAPSQPHR